MLPLGAFETTADGAWDYVSPVLIEMLGGLPTSSLLGREWLSRVHHDDLQRVLAEYRQARDFDRPWRHSFRFITADGSVLHVGVDANPLPQERGERGVRYVGLIRDRSQVVRALEQAQEAQTLVEEMLDLVREGVAINRGEVTLAANPAAARILGYDTPEQLVGRAPVGFLHPHDRPRFAAFLRSDAHTFTTGQVVRPDGSEVTIVVQGRVVMYAGAPARLVTFVPITDPLVEAAISARNEMQLHALEGLLTVPYHRIGLEGEEAGRIQFANAAFCELVGRSAVELLGMDVVTLTPPGEAAATRHAISHFVSSEGRAPTRTIKRFLRPDGSTVRVELLAAIYRDPVTTKAVSLTVCTDLTPPPCAQELSPQQRAQCQAFHFPRGVADGVDPR